MQAEEEETKERLFESLLSECRDAIQAVREELKPDQVSIEYCACASPQCVCFHN